MATFLVVAHDVAPSQGLEKLAQGLEAAGETVIRWLGYGQALGQFPDFSHWKKKISNVVIGMSSNRLAAAVELMAIYLAQIHYVPISLYADNFGVIGRPWFVERADVYRRVFLPAEAELVRAEQLYSRAEVIVTGNPIWEEFSRPAVSRDAVRENLGVGQDEQIILAVGIKSPAVNLPLFNAVIEAVDRLEVRQFYPRPRVVICPHPAEPDRAIYQELVRNLPRTAILPPEIKTTDIVSGSDLVVNSFSTVGIQAAYLRVPVIDWLSRLGLAQHKEMTGDTRWYPAEVGISRPVYGSSVRELAKAMKELARERDRHYLVERQATILPTPIMVGQAVAKMVESLLPWL